MKIRNFFLKNVNLMYQSIFYGSLGCRESYSDRLEATKNLGCFWCHILFSNTRVIVIPYFDY